MTTTWRIWINEDNDLKKVDAKVIAHLMDLAFRRAYILRMGKYPPSWMTTIDSDKF